MHFISEPLCRLRRRANGQQHKDGRFLAARSRPQTPTLVRKDYQPQHRGAAPLRHCEYVSRRRSHPKKQVPSAEEEVCLKVNDVNEKAM